MKTKLSFPDYTVKDEVAIVTGGSMGIGRACALVLANAGANVAIISLPSDQENLAKTAKEIEELGGKALPIGADITKTKDIENVINKVMDYYGKISILVNSAGVCFRESATELKEESWDATFNVNVKGLFFYSQKIAKKMIEQNRGKIVNIASMNSLTSLAEHASYCASKAGVWMLTKTLALEWAKHNINVNAVAPTFTKTEMAKHVLENKKKYEAIISNIPLKRMAEPMEVASAVLFLASPASDFITGETILVDGGWTTGTELKY